MPVNNFIKVFKINKLRLKIYQKNLLTNRRFPVYTLWTKTAVRLIHHLSTSSCQGSQQVQIIFVNAFVRLAQRLDPATTVQHRRMVPTAKCIADLRQAVIR